MTFHTTIARLREASYAAPSAGEDPNTCRVGRHDLRTALHVIDRLDADLRRAGVLSHGAVTEPAPIPAGWELVDALRESLLWTASSLAAVGKEQDVITLEGRKRTIGEILDEANAALDAPTPASVAPGDAHPDDIAVDRFAAAMKAKLAQKRAEGRGGWDDKSQCSQDQLSLMLRAHVAKGDPVDVGNFAMMLHQRGERVSGRDDALRPAPAAGDALDAARLDWLATHGVAVRAKSDSRQNIVYWHDPMMMREQIDAARAALSGEGN